MSIDSYAQRKAIYIYEFHCQENWFIRTDGLYRNAISEFFFIACIATHTSVRQWDDCKVWTQMDFSIFAYVCWRKIPYKWSKNHKSCSIISLRNSCFCCWRRRIHHWSFFRVWLCGQMVYGLTKKTLNTTMILKNVIALSSKYQRFCADKLELRCVADYIILWGCIAHHLSSNELNRCDDYGEILRFFCVCIISIFIVFVSHGAKMRFEHFDMIDKFIKLNLWILFLRSYKYELT